MPELPEVETVKNEVSPRLIGRCFRQVKLLWEGMVRGISPAEFCVQLPGNKVHAINRRGKYIIVGLDGPKTLLLHLKMSGSLLLGDSGDEPPLYTRAIFQLDDGSEIFFRDPRKFGRLWLVNDPAPIIDKLGPEPLEKEFTPELLAIMLSRRQAPIKALLCDQELIAGIGNLYADEALFLAKIYPLRTGSSLTRDEVVQLHRAIQEVLQAGLRNKGASIVNYYRPDGTVGTAHSEFRVAHRFKQLCYVCGTTIERIKVRGRGTYFCPKCQPITLKAQKSKAKTAA